MFSRWARGLKFQQFARCHEGGGGGCLTSAASIGRDLTCYPLDDHGRELYRKTGQLRSEYQSVTSDTLAVTR